MRKILLLASMLFAAVALADGTVDESRHYRVNLFPDAAPPIYVAYRVQGDSVQAPFKWTVTLTDTTGKVLLKADVDDTALDPKFSADGFVAGCKGYEACKRKWYFEDLPTSLPGDARYVRRGTMLEDWQLDALKKLAGDFLKAKGLNADKGADVIREMEDLVNRGGYGSFILPAGPTAQGLDYMLVPSLGYFVPFSSE